MENVEFSLPLKIKIKKERISPPKQLTPPLSDKKEAKHDVLEAHEPFPIEQPEQKKVMGPVKSSNEILAELFQVFNAAPPESLLSNNLVEILRGARTAKKHHRKKHKRKHDGAIESDSEHHIKSKKKKKSSKKIKEEPAETKLLEDGELDTTIVKNKKHSKKSKKHKKSKTRSPEKETQGKTEKVDKMEKTVSSGNSNNKIQINLKNMKFVDAPDHVKHKYDHDEFSSELSLSDEFDDSSSVHYGDKRYNDFYRSSSPHGYRSRSRDHHRNTSPRRSSKDRDYYRHDSRFGASRRNSNYHNSSRSYRSYSRSRSRSRSGERIDKKRLLEIARKNAITMLKSGTLPGSQYLAPDIKERALEKMRYGGKTIEELTEYCRKLSNGECLGDLSSVSGDDSDHDKEGNEKAFHHPFVLKERGPIVMNIKNAVPIAPKTAEQTKALLMQYPVSSGQQHRLNESEWVPVKPTKPTESVPVPSSSAKKSSRQTTLNNQGNKVGFDEWSNKTVPPLAPPPPSVPVSECNASQPVIVPGNVPIQYPIGRPAYETALPIDVPPPSDSAQIPSDLDISCIITQRLNAMRKLQDNPQDGEAQLLMNNAQDSMSAWLSSKHTPGQFIGSTGATILTAKQLSPGLQAWAKKDQLVMTQPVAGGMGMHLLQKMGWKPGEGLGKDKSGSLIPLLLEVKLDKKGLLANEENPLNQQKRKINKKILAANVEHKHPVSLLGELAAKRKWQTPVYEMVDESGPGHNKNFLFKVVVNGQQFLPPTPAANKKEAKAITAKFALQQMGVLNS